MEQFFLKLWHGPMRRPYKLNTYVNKGTGAPILLLHGIASTGKTWDPLIVKLDTQKWHIVAYDLLGFGKSPTPEDRKYDVIDHAESVLATLDKKFKKQKIIIVGHSMGCLIASHIATVRPDMVKHLILYEPPLFADSPEFRSHSRRKRLYFAFFQEIIRHPKAVYNYSAIASKFAEGRALSVSKASWHAFERSLLNTVMKQKAYTELKHIGVPTEIIYGKYDFMVTRASVKKMLQSNKHVTFHLVGEMHDVTDRAAKYIIKLLKPLY